MAKTNKNIRCKYLKKIWVETERGQENVLSCICEDCIEFETEYLNIKNCNEDYCTFFEDKDDYVDN